MRLLSAMRVLPALILMFPSALFAQSSPGASSASVPRLINISGVFRPADGQPAGAVETVTVSIYADQEGGAPLWQETQTVALDGQGRYTLLLGASQPDGIPAAVFGTGDAQWRGTLFERAGEVEGPRVRITSVPYALRASDADTLGGRPASAYCWHLPAGTAWQPSRRPPALTWKRQPRTSCWPGTPNFLAKYVNGADVGNSAVYEANGMVGVGTTTPLDYVHVRFNDPGGATTGLAVQNLGNTATSYSGTLFYDQFGALGQFQGFNNVTHEYRINNIARVSPGGAFNGSINFMTRQRVEFIVAPNGNIGIGTTAPSALLEVSNAVPGGPANMWMTSYTNAIGPYYMGRRARGTPGAPTAVQTGDGLAGLLGQGYGTTAFGPGLLGTGGMTVQAAQNWTDTAQGTALTFTTTSINATAPTTRMTLDASGNLGIGTTTVPATGILEVSNAALPLPFAQVTATTFASSAQGSLFVGRKARGTAAAPSAVQNGDVLAGVLGRGYGATNFNGTGSGGMFVRAAETWTDSAQGTSINFNSTAIGTNTPTTRMTVAANGNIGIGTTTPWATVEAARDGDVAVFGATSFGECCAGFVARLARGTAAAPAAVQLGDPLALFQGDGYGATDFSSEAGGMVILAAENWTDTAQGTAVAFTTTPVGSTEEAGRMAIMPDGNVGIGTFTDFPTITDKLQVFGDIRVGTTGTNGCIKDFGGAPIAGTCSSDRRFKKDITPFSRVLDRVTALQPVHYSWRASEFPDRHFGDRPAYGLIAQDVEQLLPELVVTNDDGFKAVDYSALPLLTIQAVKDLKSENDALKQRVSDLERLVNELLATTPRR